MYFLAEDPLFDTEKPYSLRFPPEGDLPQTNVKRERHGVTLHSLRNMPNIGIEERGFEIIDFPSQMLYEDFADEATVRSKYLPEVREALIKTLGARHVHVLDFAVIDEPGGCIYRYTVFLIVFKGPSKGCGLPNLYGRGVQARAAYGVGAYW
jgi:hypothetical protein